MAKQMILAAMLLASVLTASAGVKSAETFVFLRPETSSFWHTATNNVLELPVEFPQGASSATLTVTGIGYRQTISGITGDTCTLALPAATNAAEENVYSLVLAFDDGTTNSVRLGLVQGLGEDGRGSTRCVAPKDGRAWNFVERKAVLPIPYGMTSFMLDGVETDTGLDGAQGWFAVGPLAPQATQGVALATAAGESYSAELVGKAAGFYLFFR